MHGCAGPACPIIKLLCPLLNKQLKLKFSVLGTCLCLFSEGLSKSVWAVSVDRAMEKGLLEECQGCLLLFEEGWELVHWNKVFKFQVVFHSTHLARCSGKAACGKGDTLGQNSTVMEVFMWGKGQWKRDLFLALLLGWIQTGRWCSSW